MARLGLAVTEVLLAEYGKSEVLRRLSDPFWFQSLGAVMGMDWHSAGLHSFVEEPHTAKGEDRPERPARSHTSAQRGGAAGRRAFYAGRWTGAID